MSTQQAGANTRVQKTARKTQPAGSRTNIARFHVQEASQAAWLPPRTGDAGWFPGAAGGQGALSCKGGEAAVRPDGDTLAIPRGQGPCGLQPRGGADRTGSLRGEGRPRAVSPSEARCAPNASWGGGRPGARALLPFWESKPWKVHEPESE